MESNKFAESWFYKTNVVWFLVAYLGIVSIFSIYSDYESTQELKKLKIENRLLIKQLNGKDSALERCIRDYARTK